MEDCDIQKLRILIDQTEELVEIFESLQERAKLLTTGSWAMFREVEMLKEKYDNKLMLLNIMIIMTIIQLNCYYYYYYY